MAKHPAPGRVKTRLAAALGDETACALSRAFILDLADRLDGLPYAVTWAYWPPDAPFAVLVPGACCRAQEGGDLGARMRNAIDAALADRAAAAIVIGADVPHVDAAVLAEAAEALADGTDVVLGPAHDGGYYLIGVAEPRVMLFEGIAWGSRDVLATTLARAAGAGLRSHLLPATFDVDEPADIVALQALLSRGRDDLPRTAKLLAALHSP